MDAGVEARLRAGEVTFGVEDARLLRAVAKHGSVKGAVESLGRSRARALGRLEDLEQSFGPLVTRHRGGVGGGGSRLTPEALTLLDRFDRLVATLSGTAAVAEAVLHGQVLERDGELGVVETDAGTVRALLVDTTADPEREEPGDDVASPTIDDVPPDAAEGERLGPGSTVQVSIRADTVTLHAPTEAPAGDATSARNRFRGTVTDVDSGASVARVSVDVGAEEPLLALVTHDSRDRLELAPGVEVVASFKATATRATAVEG